MLPVKYPSQWFPSELFTQLAPSLVYPTEEQVPEPLRNAIGGAPAVPSVTRMTMPLYAAAVGVLCRMLRLATTVTGFWIGTPATNRRPAAPDTASAMYLKRFMSHPMIEFVPLSERYSYALAGCHVRGSFENGRCPSPRRE